MVLVYLMGKPHIIQRKKLSKVKKRGSTYVTTVQNMIIRDLPILIESLFHYLHNII